MSNDNTGGLLGNPLPIVLVALLAAGVLIKHDELRSSRPNDSERVKFVPAGLQDVEARLWQDPFAAIEKHDGRSKTESHVPQQLRDRIKEIVQTGGQVRIIGVSLFGGSYSEAAESRRRTRFAVLSALGFHGYSPDNSDAIGYFHVKLPDGGRQIAWPDLGTAGLDFNLIGPAGSTMLLQLVREPSKPQPVDMTIPYEWFEKREPHSTVLVLWLNEDKLTAGPRTKLGSLVTQLTPPKAPRRPAPTNAAKVDLAAIPNDAPRVFVANATIPGCDLDPSIIGKPWHCFTIETSKLNNELQRLAAIRTIGTDDVLAAALLWELWQRGVNRELIDNDNLSTPTAANATTRHSPSSMARKCMDGLVLISEWDSPYARALSRNLREGFSDGCNANGNPWRPVRSFSYLRGLDGMLPDVDKTSANAPRKDDNGKAKDLWAQLEDGPPERAEGRSQYDYLRRLGDEIARLDNDRGFAPNGVKAIGIAGSDVYDKLLILQALRGRFKDKIFFTTDLDARYLHANQKDWARNLVVASNFDLSLRPALQQSTLPFRDGYQAATYLATLMALEVKSLEYWNRKLKDWLRPQIFEIGRSGAVHLASPSVDDLTKWIKSGYADGSAPPAEDTKCDDYWAACKNIEPGRPRPSLPSGELLAIIWIIFLGTVSVALFSPGMQATARAAYGALTSPVPLKAWVARFWLIAGSTLVFAAVSMVAGIRRTIDASFAQGVGEPFVWLEGISVWPSVVLRFVGCVTTLALVILSMIWIRRQAHFICKNFELPIPEKWKLARSRWAAVSTGPHLDLAAFGPDGGAIVKASETPVEIASLWQNYLRLTSWREKTWWILASTAIVFLIGFALVFLFGRPSFPHRGLLVETLYRRVTFVNALLLWLVIFWVGYETRACARFVAVLSDVKSVWPNSLLDREEARTDVPRAHLDDYLDFQLIVLATRRIYRLIYLPFVLLLFLVLARSSIFDAMDFPLALILVTGLALAYALYTAILLRKSAEAARAKALDHYNARLLAQARLKDGSLPVDTGVAANSTPISAEQTKLLMERIRSTREGAFASFTQQPALQALLLPFGGYGGVQLVEYLINF
jgi:hypothetical protein